MTVTPRNPTLILTKNRFGPRLLSFGHSLCKLLLSSIARISPAESSRKPMSDSSVTGWLERLETGDDEAAAKLWNKYFDRLVHLAHGRLQAKYGKVNDAEDIALSAFHSFCRGVENNKFPGLSDRDGLWRLLVSITIHKLLHVVRDQKRLKRGGQFHELNQLDSSSDSIAAVNLIVSREPSPEFALELAEQYQQMMLSLEDHDLVRLATWKMEGFSNEEIALKLDRSTRTVERKLQLIRKIWIHRQIDELDD